MAKGSKEVTSWRGQLFDVMRKYRPHHEELAEKTRKAMAAKGEVVTVKPPKTKKSRGLYE